MSQNPPERPNPPGSEIPPEIPAAPPSGVPGETPPPGPATAATAATATGGRGLARMAGVISAATFVSRLLGLVREQVFAIQFGAGYAVDAFQVAFRIPNLLRDLLAEGAMNAAFVPTLTQAEHRGGPEAALRLTNLVVNLLLVVISAVTLAGILAAPWIVRFMAPGFADEAGKVALTTLLTQIMMPFLLFISLAAAAMGFLNTRRVFFIPAFSPTVLNLALIVAGFAISPFMPRFGLEPIVGMAIGAFLGGFGQLAIQIPSMRAHGFRWRPILSFRDPDVIRMVSLMAPAAVGIAAANVNVFVSTFLASNLEQGSVSWLNYAYRLMQLPIGLFGVAVATVTLAEVARHAAAKNMADLKETLSFSLGLVLFLTIPATIALVVLARPIIALLYEHGRFTPTDTIQTARALWGYAVGLAAFSAVRVMVPAFYSLGLARIPVTVSIASIGATLVLYFILMGPFQHAGLALATSIGSVMNFTVLAWMLRRRIGGIGGRALAMSAGKIFVAGALAGALAWIVANRLEAVVGLRSITAQLIVVGAGLVVGTFTYVIAARALRVRELLAIANRVRR